VPPPSQLNDCQWCLQSAQPNPQAVIPLPCRHCCMESSRAPAHTRAGPVRGQPSPDTNTNG
jgi:hypothetical protein